MAQQKIHFFAEDIPFEWLSPQKEKIARWIAGIIQQENYRLVSLNIVLCSDSYLYSKNVQYLQHDTLTDVITFTYTAQPLRAVEGEIYISLDRVRENAQAYHTCFEEELYRVMIHGVLHLVGYQDKTVEEKTKMSVKETTCLRTLSTLAHSK